MREDLDRKEEIGSPYRRNALAEVRPTSVARERQDRGWTPQALAEALRNAGLPGSKSTIRRAILDGEIPHTRTLGGHVRIDATWVREMYPSLEGRAAEAA